MEPIRPEMPPFLAPIISKLVVAAMYGGIGLIMGSLLGYILRRLIYVLEYQENYLAKGLLVTGGVMLLLIVTAGILIGVFDQQGFAFIYAIGALVGTVSFARPWWSMRR